MLPKTIILHYKKLSERKSNIIKQIKKYNFKDFEFYEDYDQDEIENFLELYEPQKSNPDKWRNKVLLWGDKALNYHCPVLNIAEISITIKFGKTFEKLSKEKFDYCIVFEDDVLLCENFEDKFKDYLSRTPDDWDAVYFGSCVGLRSEIKPNTIAYHKKDPASRGGASTLFKYKTIKDLARTWFPFNLVSDWELAYQHAFHQHKVYWWDPALTQQGSETGLFKSTLR